MITRSLWQGNNGEVLLFKVREMMKPGDSDKADIGKTRGDAFPAAQSASGLFSTVTRALCRASLLRLTYGLTLTR
ncbi:hypothetical protein DFO53_3003 [Enterobacter sp. AG5470]|nr:hypothetical protein DFO53_3003 [Enterobacter sp. AG5470]